MLRLLNEIIGLTVALIAGLYTYKYMNSFYKIFFFQLIAFILIYILAQVVKFIQLSNSLPIDNQWVYNLSMPIETGFLAWAASEYFKTNKRRYLIWFGYVAFLIIFIAELSIKGVNTFSNHGYIAESVLLLVLYLLVLYTHFTNGNSVPKNSKGVLKENGTLMRSPETWIFLGIALYFGGVVPYLSLMHYLQNGHEKINSFLYYFIIEGLENVRYVMLAGGFWLVRINALLSENKENENSQIMNTL